MSLSRPSSPLNTRAPRALITRKPVSLTAPVAESMFKRRERLAVKSWGASGTTHFFAGYLKRPSGASPLSRTWENNDKWPDMLQSLSPSQKYTCLRGGGGHWQQEGFLLNQYGWMQSQIIRGSPLRPDRRKPTDFHLFSFACTRGAHASVRVTSKYPCYT